MKRHQYSITLSVKAMTREECVSEMRKMFLRLEADDWPNENRDKAGVAPRPSISYSHGPLVPSLEDRVKALEAEFGDRLGGISEENAA